MNVPIGFIGAGNMATAIIRRLVADGYPTESVMCSDLDIQRGRALASELGIQFDTDNQRVAAWAKVAFLAVKPNVVPQALPEIASALAGKALASIAAGVTTARLTELSGGNVRVLRAMPNTPALIGQGVTAVSSAHNLMAEELGIVLRVFGCVGTVVTVEERLMNAVTALSGSGPALPYLLIETMADAGVRIGLPRAQALELATQTVLGSAMMQKETREHPAKLRDDVCSPGGSTIELVAALEECGYQHAIHEALRRCVRRVGELGS